MAKQRTNVNRLVKSYRDNLQEAYQDALKEVKRQLNYVKWRYGNNPTLVQYQALMNKQNRIKNKIKDIDEILKDLDNRTFETIRNGLSKAYKDVYYNTGFVLESSTGLNLSFSLINENVVRHAVLNPFDKIKWDKSLKKWNTELNDRIRKEISSGLISGQGIDKISSKIVSKTNIAFHKAQKIVRTEIHKVTAHARKDAFEVTSGAAERLGMNIRRRWLATFDGRTRDEHQAMDGKYADENGYWVESLNEYVEGPGLGNNPRFVINCRCTEVTEVENYPLKSRLDNITKETIPFKTYDEWINDVMKRKN